MKQLSLFRTCLLASFLMLTGCEHEKAEAPAVPIPANELSVAILNDPVFYQPANADGEASGFDYDLLVAFAQAQGKQLLVVPVPTTAELMELLHSKQVDMVVTVPPPEPDEVVEPETPVATPAPPESRPWLMRMGLFRSVADLPAAEPKPTPRRFIYSQATREAQAIIVRHADAQVLDENHALAGHTIEVLPGTIEAENLRSINSQPPIVIEHPPVNNAIDLMARVSDYQTELAATDSLHFDVAANFYPDLQLAMKLPGKVSYVWGFRAEDDALRGAADSFITSARQNGLLVKLEDRYFGHINRITAQDSAQLMEDIRSRLPRYRNAFFEAQDTTGIDWRLLAALAYQESKWDPKATSRTGVRGMMMLTVDTAERMELDNRLSATQSIEAGARYLAELLDRLPSNIQFPDRQWLALAAYNLGMGHLNGARQFAEGMKKDSTSWYEMKKVLPLLAKREYYSRLKAGRARGGEAVIMVENVRNYYDILQRFQPARTSPSANTNLATAATANSGHP